jgi:hypothetical protein
LGALAFIALPLGRARAAGYPLRQWWRVPLLVALKDLSQITGALTGVVDATRARRRLASPARSGGDQGGPHR